MSEEFGQPIQEEPEEQPQQEPGKNGLIEEAKDQLRESALKTAKESKAVANTIKKAVEAAKAVANAAKATALAVANSSWILPAIGIGIALFLVIVFFMGCVPSLKCEYGKCPGEGTNVVKDISTLRLTKALSGSEEDRKKAILQDATQMITDLQDLRSGLKTTTQEKVDKIITLLRTINNLKAEGESTTNAVNEAYDLLDGIKDELYGQGNGKLVDDNWTVIRVGAINFTGSIVGGACSSCNNVQCKPCKGKDGKCDYFVYRANDAHQELREKIAQTASALVGKEHAKLDPGNNAQCKALIYAVLNVMAGLNENGSGAQSGNPYITTGALPSSAYFQEISGSPAVQRGDMIWFSEGNSPNCTGGPHWAIEL